MTQLYSMFKHLKDTSIPLQSVLHVHSVSLLASFCCLCYSRAFRAFFRCWHFHKLFYGYLNSSNDQCIFSDLDIVSVLHSDIFWAYGFLIVSMKMFQWHSKPSHDGGWGSNNTWHSLFLEKNIFVSWKDFCFWAFVD